MEPNQRTYDQLTEEQRASVAIQYSGDSILGNDPRAYLYELTHSGDVLSRRKLTQAQRYGKRADGGTE